MEPFSCTNSSSSNDIAAAAHILYRYALFDNLASALGIPSDTIMPPLVQAQMTPWNTFPRKLQQVRI